MQIFYVIIAAFVAPLPVTARYIHFVEDTRGFRVPFNTGTGAPLEERETTVGVNYSVVRGEVIEPLIRNDPVEKNADVSKEYGVPNENEHSAANDILYGRGSPGICVREKREDSVYNTKNLKDQRMNMSNALDGHVGVDVTAGNPSRTSTPGPRNQTGLITTAPGSERIKAAGVGIFTFLFVFLFLAYLLQLMFQKYCGRTCPNRGNHENLDEYELLPL